MAVRGVGTPTVDDYVRAFLTSMRAPLKHSTTFTPAGRTTLRHAGERVIYGPKGQPIRVVENPDGGTQVEHGDHLHAVVRPRTVTMKLGG